MSKNKIKILIAVVLLVGTGIFFLLRGRGADDETWKSITVTRGDVSVTITATGTVAPENRLEIKPPIAGRVEEVLVQEGESVRKGQLMAWMSSSERAALLDAARARGEAELKRWREFYNPTPILSPIDGTVILRNVEPGQSFTTQDFVFVLSDQLTVKAQVDETDISEVKLKQPAEILLDAYPQKSFSAHVDQIAYDAKLVNNVTTYVVDVLPEQPPEFLRSGMTASVKFFIASKNGILSVPLEAVRTVAGRSIVRVGKESAKSTERDVTIGINDGRVVEIVTGLKEGETVWVSQKRPTNRNSSGAASPFSPMGGRPRR